ncbi:MAG: HD domain-containing protein [Desulfovibrionaceae bacterium]|jgi:3'-5' exoribonuclease|nr:HD domain-containing protein [Desulfovibrionaceae bacterium]
MSTTQRRCANALSPGERVDEVYVIGASRRGEARNGPFWSLVLQDASGSVEAKIWSPASQDYDRLPPGTLARVQGMVQSFRDQAQVNVERLVFLDPADDAAPPLSDLVPASAEEPALLYARLLETCREQIRFPALRKLVFDVFEDAEIHERLLVAPGAKNVHHAYVGGLLEHTLSVAGLCLRFCDHYPQLDREMLLAAAAFHDLGKAWELTGGLACDYSDEGRLLGHITIGLEKLSPFLADCGLDADLVLHLKHIILSHHGEYEYGSPRRPKTAEAMALHYADNLDAKMNQVAGVFAAMDDEAAATAANGATGANGAPGSNGNGAGGAHGGPGESVGQWSPYQRTLERFLFNPRRSPGGVCPEDGRTDGRAGGRANGRANGRAGGEKTKDCQQCSLPLKG